MCGCAFFYLCRCNRMPSSQQAKTPGGTPEFPLFQFTSGNSLPVTHMLHLDFFLVFKGEAASGLPRSGRDSKEYLKVRSSCTELSAWLLTTPTSCPTPHRCYCHRCWGFSFPGIHYLTLSRPSNLDPLH